MSEANLITSCLFNGQDFLIKMNVIDNFLEISVTDKQSGEEWQCCYDHAYIENLTHKTGNFKHFDIFLAMLKSGLLKTSECISLDLLTYDDLEALRVRRIKSSCSKILRNKQQNNRRYLILIYNVEFDRILYPLPLEYCGPPDPLVLQGTIRKLEVELAKTRQELHMKNENSGTKQIVALQRRIDDLLNENSSLHAEIYELSRTGSSKTELHRLQSAINHLERSVLSERRSHHLLVDKMKLEKSSLLREIDKLRSENRRFITMTNKNAYKSPTRLKSNERTTGEPIKDLYKNSRLMNTKLQITSNSPRKVKSEGCTNSTKTTHFSRFHSKKRNCSRSSSLSSCRPSDEEGNFGDHCPSPRRLKERNDRSKEKNRLSRNNSKERSSCRPSSIDRASSVSSGSTRHHSARPSSSSQLLKMKLKTSEEDFNTLEHRICSLQRMLQENVNF